MRIRTLFNILASIACVLSALGVQAQSTRPERRLINEGNKLYVERKYKEAAAKYEDALKVNANSAVARYNLGLSQIKQVVNPADTTPKNQEMLDRARQNLGSVAAMAKDKPGLAAKANYNLGNLEFNSNKIKESIEYYKQALRIDPNDNAARKNLRIAQLKQQNQDKNKDQNQNQDKNKDKNQDKNKDQNKDQQQQQQDKQQQQQEKINQQAAAQILQSIDNKENQTRARVNQARKGDKSQGAASHRKRW